MIRPLATSWVVVLEVESEDPAQTTLVAFGPFAGDRARERAQAFCNGRTREDVYSASVLPMQSPILEATRA